MLYLRYVVWPGRGQQGAVSPSPPHWECLCIPVGLNWLVRKLVTSNPGDSNRVKRTSTEGVNPCPQSR